MTDVPDQHGEIARLDHVEVVGEVALLHQALPGLDLDAVHGLGDRAQLIGLEALEQIVGLRGRGVRAHDAKGARKSGVETWISHI